MTAARKSVLVCGGGVTGLCCAYYLKRRGHEVTVVDRNPDSLGSCAFGSAGMICPSHFVPLAAPGVMGRGLRWMLDSKSPFFVKMRADMALLRWGILFARSANHRNVERSAPVLARLGLESRALYQALRAELPEFGLVNRGLFILCKTQKALDEEAAHVAKAAEFEIPAQVVTARGAAELDPQIRMEVVGAIYFPLDCHLEPGRFLAAMAQKLVEIGVTFRWNTPISGWRESGGKVQAAVGEEGEIRADEFVLAGGAWSPELAHRLGLRLPMQPGKGYSLTLDNARPLPRLCSILAEAHAAVTPMGSALRLGGTMELSGFDRNVRKERVRQILESASGYFPELDVDAFRGVRAWHGFRPVTPDGLPYVGRSVRHCNLTVAAGHAMVGLSLAPATGRLVADLVDGGKPDPFWEPLNPGRFG